MELGEIEQMRPPRREARRYVRDRVIRRVQLIVADRRIEGIMLDISDQGARVQLSGPMEMPEEFTLRSTDGSAIRVARRWVQDRQIGVEFLAAAEVHDDVQAAPRLAPSDMRRSLQAAPANEALMLLARAAHYGDEDLRTACRDLAASLDRVERALAVIQQRRDTAN